LHPTPVSPLVNTSYSVTVDEGLTGNCTTTACVVNSYEWSASWLGSTGTINGNITSDYTVTATNSVPTSGTLTNLAIYNWSTYWAPMDNEDVRCIIKGKDDNNNDWTIQLDQTVHVKGIPPPPTLYMAGPSTIQECCTDNVTYSCVNYVDADIFAWTYPSTWLVVGSSTGSSITLKPDYTNGGSVSCKLQISTVPANYYRTISVSGITRPAPPNPTIISSTNFPCTGGQITLTYPASPCGLSLVSPFLWNSSNPDWVIVKGQGTNTITVNVGISTSNTFTVTATYNGGCSVTQTLTPILAHTPADPVFNNGCPQYDANGCSPGPKRVCAQNGSTIDIVSATDASSYNCYVSPPWKLNNIAANTPLSAINVNFSDIHGVNITLPFWNTTNSTVHSGTYYVQATNCSNTYVSNWVSYNFIRENDFWCNCAIFDPCECVPLFVSASDPCGSNHGQRLSENIEDKNFTQFKIYPNPSNGNFKLEMPVGNKQITITDMTGRIIFGLTTDESFMNLNMNENSVGVYYVTVKTDKQIFKNLISLQK